jgi:type VI secretion system secreted protein Hcp
MAAFLQLEGIEGESTDKQHDKWIIIQSMSSPIFRSIPEGARDSQRSRGDTTLGDVVVVRELDKSSVKLQEASANGKFYPKAKINFTSQVGDKQEPYLKYELENVIITSYSVHANAEGDPLPTEEVTLNCTKATWTYVTLNPKTGEPGPSVEGKYDPGKGSSS